MTLHCKLKAKPPINFNILCKTDTLLLSHHTHTNGLTHHAENPVMNFSTLQWVFRLIWAFFTYGKVFLLMPCLIKVEVFPPKLWVLPSISLALLVLFSVLYSLHFGLVDMCQNFFHLWDISLSCLLLADDAFSFNFLQYFQIFIFFNLYVNLLQINIIKASWSVKVSPFLKPSNVTSYCSGKLFRVWIIKSSSVILMFVLNLLMQILSPSKYDIQLFGFFSWVQLAVIKLTFQLQHWQRSV